LSSAISNDNSRTVSQSLFVATPSVDLMALTPLAEEIIEQGCRTCYLSFHRFDPPKSTEELIRKILQKKHFSVLEHASATFRIKGGSRVFTHELVRHRFISPSQESQRYVCYANKPGRAKTTDFQFVVPESIIKAQFAGESASKLYEQAVLAAYELYEKLLDLGVPPEDARYLLPNATVSQIVITANFRELRHFFCVRTHPRAHWEIREIALMMLRVMLEKAPIVFGDFKIDEETQSATFEFET
jgi:thymidylate synthase (FAD)